MKRGVLLVVVLGGMLLLGAPAVHAAPVLWTVNGHYYEVVTTGSYWQAAKTAAEARTWNGLAGHLVTITSAEENQFLVSQLGSAASFSWIGAYQPAGSAEPKGGWTWITGESWGYESWSANEPNNADTRGENVAEFWAWNGGVWNDLNENYAYRKYIVEYEQAQSAVPEPASMALLGMGLVGVFGMRKRYFVHRT